MEQDDLMQPVDEQTGELDQTFEVNKNTPVAIDHLATVLIILTSIFLFLSILMTSFQLYSVYDIWKSPQDIQKREQAARSGK